MKKFFQTRMPSGTAGRRMILYILDAILFAFFCGLVMRQQILPAIKTAYPWIAYPELRVLAAKNKPFNELSVYFTRISQKKGAEYAYDLLKIAPMPPNIDMHLMGHIVGDELYKQKGLKGIYHCTQDFRNACSHSIVVGYFLKYGEAGLPDIARTCRQAPGGVGAYTMCFHGLGHGVLAALDYDLPKALSVCQSTGTPEYNYREASECTGGAIMEIISGGFHNKSAWEKAHAKYLNSGDPLYPCTDSMVPGPAKSSCYEYITPHLVESAGGRLDDTLTLTQLSTAFGYCSNAASWADTAACYRGFGKEFVVLVHARDIRDFTTMTDHEFAKIYTLCSAAGNPAGETECVQHAVDSLYWGGENDAVPAIGFCYAAGSDVLRKSCFTHLFEAMRYFTPDTRERSRFCSKVPAPYKTLCSTYE